MLSEIYNVTLNKVNSLLLHYSSGHLGLGLYYLFKYTDFLIINMSGKIRKNLDNCEQNK